MAFLEGSAIRHMALSERGPGIGVVMQAFYWNCPGNEGRPGEWWNLVREQVPRLAATGFTALWLPVVCQNSIVTLDETLAPSDAAAQYHSC